MQSQNDGLALDENRGKPAVFALNCGPNNFLTCDTEKDMWCITTVSTQARVWCVCLWTSHTSYTLDYLCNTLQVSDFLMRVKSGDSQVLRRTLRWFYRIVDHCCWILLPFARQVSKHAYIYLVGAVRLQTLLHRAPTTAAALAFWKGNHNEDKDMLLQVYNELVVLERLHKAPNFSPAVMLEAITRPLLQQA